MPAPDDALLDAQLAVLSARWPHVAAAVAAAPAPSEVAFVQGVPRPTLRIDGIQLAGAVQPDAEAALQARAVPESASRARVYGVAQGALPRALLRRKGLAQLDVVVLAASALRHVLRSFDLRDWLGDPRVTLQLGRDAGRPEGPFAVAPADLRLADADGMELRDELLLSLAAPYQADRFREAEALWAEHEASNADRLAAARSSPVCQRKRCPASSSESAGRLGSSTRSLGSTSTSRSNRHRPSQRGLKTIGVANDGAVTAERRLTLGFLGAAH